MEPLVVVEVELLVQEVGEVEVVLLGIQVVEDGANYVLARI